MSSGFHAHLLDDTSAFVVMWQEIEEEREDTSFVQMKRGRHRYPGLGAHRVSSADPVRRQADQAFLVLDRVRRNTSDHIITWNT